MKPSQRLEYLSDIREDLFQELWSNCFERPQDLEHMNRYGFDRIPGREAFKRYIKQPRGYRTWLVRRREEGDIIGCLVHGSIIPGNPNNVGFSIGLPYTRQGYATEALQALLAHLREEGRTETSGQCLPDNVASIRTMERCGFQRVTRTGAPHGAPLGFRYTFTP